MKRSRYNPLKDTPDIFAEDVQTAAEKILDEISETTPDIVTPQDLQNIPQIAARAAEHSPQVSPQQAEEELRFLIDKYYNGDRELPPNERHQNRQKYKDELIALMRRWGMLYVEKNHYPLSRDEKHIIRIDYYGTVDSPNEGQLSPQYKQNYTSFPVKYSRKEKKKLKEQTKEENITNLQHANREIDYPLEAYDLSYSPMWRLFRLFPRFYRIENQVRLQMQKMKINPEIIPYMNSYDFSDILYRRYAKNPQTKNASIFLGARQSFVKDVFLHHDDWLRKFFQHKNYHERYIEALMIAARSKGVTNNIRVKGTPKEFIYDFILSNRAEFRSFLHKQAQDGNHIDNILNRLNTNGAPLTPEMNNFILRNKNDFKQTLKHRYIIDRQINALLELVSPHEIPPYVKENLRGFILSHEDDYKDFLQQQGIGESEIKLRLQRIKNRTSSNLPVEQLTAFAENRHHLFKDYMRADQRDENYICFALNSLHPVPYPDYVNELLTGFIRSQQPQLQKFLTKNNSGDTPETLLQKIKQNGITPDIQPLVSSFASDNRDLFSSYYRQNNILTYDELKEQNADTINYIAKNKCFPASLKNFGKNFILRNEAAFRGWYVSFRLNEAQEQATAQFSNICNGINAANFPLAQNFINERREAFLNFSAQNGALFAEEDIQRQFGEFQRKGKLSPELKKGMEEFIAANGYAFRKSLTQSKVAEKEKNADLILKKIKNQGISANISAYVHKFILNNENIFLSSLCESKEDARYAENILTPQRNGKGNSENQNIIKQYIRSRYAGFIDFLSEMNNIETYAGHTIQEIENDNAGADSFRWAQEFICNNEEKFQTYMAKEKVPDQDIAALVKDIRAFKLSKDIRFNLDASGLSISFNDGMTTEKIKIGVHHKGAVQDGYDINSLLLAENKNLSVIALPDNAYEQPNIAAVNYFGNLTAIDDRYHYEFFHGLDKTEKANDRERYIARVYPSDPHLIFFGSLDPADQLSYDYSNDPRTLRYLRHAERIMEQNRQMEQEDSPYSVVNHLLPHHRNKSR